jgi:hypothetical protein
MTRIATESPPLRPGPHSPAQHNSVEPQTLTPFAKLIEDPSSVEDGLRRFSEVEWCACCLHFSYGKPTAEELDFLSGQGPQASPARQEPKTAPLSEARAIFAGDASSSHPCTAPARHARPIAATPSKAVSVAGSIPLDASASRAPTLATKTPEAEVVAISARKPPQAQLNAISVAIVATEFGLRVIARARLDNVSAHERLRRDVQALLSEYGFSGGLSLQPQQTGGI